MVSKISYFILFEIIIFAKGKPAYKPNSNHQELEYGLKKLVEDILKQGNYDVMLNHHEDHPGTHHEDITQITYNGGKPNSRYNNEKYLNAESYHGASGKNFHYNNRPSYTNMQNYNLFLRKRPETVENNIGMEETNYKPQTSSDSENIDDVLEFLNDLDKTLKIKGNNDLELRCSGNRCGESRDENDNSDRKEYDIPNKDYNRNIINDNYDRHLRCNGRSCSIDIDEDRNDRGSMRCYGNRCSRKANYRVDNLDEDDIHISNILRSRVDDDDDDDNDDDGDTVGIDSLRCVGDRCGLNRDDEDGDYREGLDSMRCVGDRCGANRDGIDSLRCVGDRCGLNRDDDDDRVGINSLSCVGDRCGLNRDDDNDEDRNSIYSLRCVGDRCGRNRADNNDDDDRVLDSFRCVGDRCGLNRDDDNDDENRDSIYSSRCVGDRCGRNREDDERDSLRCIGNRCGRSRIDDENQDSNHKYKEDQELEEMLDTYLSRALDAGLKGKDLSLSDKRRFMKEVQVFMAILKKKLTDAVHGDVKYPLNQVNL